jgi:hypothetical protein
MPKQAPTETELLAVSLYISGVGRDALVERGLLRPQLRDDPAAVALAILDAASGFLGLGKRNREPVPIMTAFASSRSTGMGGYTDLTERQHDPRAALKPLDAVLDEQAAAAQASSIGQVADEKPIPIVGNVAGLARNRFLADRLR